MLKKAAILALGLAFSAPALSYMVVTDIDNGGRYGVWGYRYNTVVVTQPMVVNRVVYVNPMRGGYYRDGYYAKRGHFAPGVVVYRYW